MELLKALQNNTLGQYNLEINHCKTLPITTYNYGVKTPPSLKYDEVTREARGLCLSGSQIVARGFRRFFNLGENPNETFGGKFRTFEKLDGSLILLYFLDCPGFKGWRINTRGGFGDNLLGVVPAKELFWRNFDLNLDLLDPNVTYTFELVGPENRIVRHYPEGVYLTGAFKKDGTEVDTTHLNWRNLPREFDCKNLSDVQELICKFEKEDPTYEGVVLLDEKGERLKVKSSTYVALHYSLANGNVLRPDRFWDLYLKGETDELMSVLDYLRPKFMEYLDTLKKAEEHLLEIFNQYKDLERKDFALQIKDEPFKSSLFLLKNGLSMAQVKEKTGLKWLENS